jgi:hypothetical protein
MERRICTTEELEITISECQKKLSLAHKMLMEDENADDEKKRLEEEMKNLHNQIFLFQNQLRKCYTQEFSKSTNTQ